MRSRTGLGGTISGNPSCKRQRQPDQLRPDRPDYLVKFEYVRAFVAKVSPFVSSFSLPPSLSLALSLSLSLSFGLLALMRLAMMWCDMVWYDMVWRLHVMWLSVGHREVAGAV